MGEVKQGMLTQADRDLLVLANHRRLPVIIGTLHACLFEAYTRHPHGQPVSKGCEEPFVALGMPADWDNLRILVLHAGHKYTAHIPWLSAVKVWRPDQAPPDDVIRRVVEAHRVGAVQQVHP